jgi:NAD dependent epimerase/dehydratase family enzyme
MASNRKTVIVTGASQGIGAGIVKAFLARGYDVVGTARSATKSKELSASEHLALIDGDIGQFETAQKVAELAIKKFGSIDAVVANAGIFLVKPFTEYTADDFRCSRLDKPRRLHLHHATCGQANAGTKGRRQHREYQRRAGRQSNRRRTCFSSHDY